MLPSSKLAAVSIADVTVEPGAKKSSLAPLPEASTAMKPSDKDSDVLKQKFPAEAVTKKDEPGQVEPGDDELLEQWLGAGKRPDDVELQRRIERAAFRRHQSKLKKSAYSTAAAVASESAAGSASGDVARSSAPSFRAAAPPSSAPRIQKKLSPPAPAPARSPSRAPAPIDQSQWTCNTLVHGPNALGWCPVGETYNWWLCIRCEGISQDYACSKGCR